MSPASAAHAFVDAINRRDVEGIVSLMTEDHVLIDSLGNNIGGIPGLRAAWAAYFAMIPDYSIAVDETLNDGAVVIMIGTARGTYAAGGRLADENHWSAPAAWRAVIRDGRIAEWRVYADLEPLRRIMAPVKS